MELSVYSKSGVNVGVIRKFTYNGNFMQETYIDADVYVSDVSAIVGVGCWVLYRGTVFTIMYDSSVKRKSSSGSAGDAIIYEGVRFHHPVEEFKHIQFRDIVPNDNNIHYTSMPDFSFWAEDITDLAERLQANIDEYYGSGVWKIYVPPIEFRDPDTETEINIEVSNISVFDALKMVADKFNTHYVVRGGTITLATAGSALEHTFSYGKDNGLTDIKRIPKGSEDICTVLRAYGSEENMPSRYYAKFGTDFPKVRFPIYVYEAEQYFSIDVNVVPKGDYVRYTFDWKEDVGEIVWSQIPSSWSGSGSGIEGRKWHLDPWGGYTTNQLVYIHPEDIDINQIPYKYIGPRFNIIPDNIAITRLMLPCFPLAVGSHMKDFIVDNNEVYGYNQTIGYFVSLKDGSLYTGSKTDVEYRLVSDTTKHDVYIESVGGISKYGRIEKAEFFDSDNDKEKKDIHPTIEEMTAVELRQAGYDIHEDIPDDARLDDVVDATFITDDGLKDKLELGIDTTGGETEKTETLQDDFFFNEPGFSIQPFETEAESSPMRYGFSPSSPTSYSMQNGGQWFAKITNCYFYASASNKFPPCVIGFEFRMYVNDVYVAKAVVPKRVQPSYTDFYGGNIPFDSMIDIKAGDSVKIKAALILDGTQEEGIEVSVGEPLHGMSIHNISFSYRIKKDLEITTWNFGFIPSVGIADHSDMVFSMKTGLCAGREFSVFGYSPTDQEEFDESPTVVYKCDRVFDDALGIYFPYSNYNILPGDKFVITGIDLPKAYVDAASERLLRYAILWLSKHDHVNFDYELSVDKVFMARDNESSLSGESLHDTIVEGELMHITDEGLGIDETLIISSLTIREGFGLVPEYDVKLRNEITDGVIATLKNGTKDNRISTKKNGYTSNNNKLDVRVLTRRVDALENPPTPPNE